MCEDLARDARGEARILKRKGGHEKETDAALAEAEVIEESVRRLKGLEERLKDVEDDQSMIQFEIQMATSDLQNAENVRSKAEKRLEQQRKDLTRNWAG